MEKRVSFELNSTTGAIMFHQINAVDVNGHPLSIYLTLATNVGSATHAGELRLSLAHHGHVNTAFLSPEAIGRLITGASIALAQLDPQPATPAELDEMAFEHLGLPDKRLQYTDLSREQLVSLCMHLVAIHQQTITHFTTQKERTTDENGNALPK